MTRERPLEVSERRKLTMPLTVVLAIVGATYAFAVGYSSLREADAQRGAEITQHGVQISDHELRIRQLEMLASANRRIEDNMQRVLQILEARQRQQPANQSHP